MSESEFEFELASEFLGGDVVPEDDLSDLVLDAGSVADEVGDEAREVAVPTGSRTTVPTGTSNQADEEQQSATLGSQQ